MQAPCPLCGSPTLLRALSLDLPFFGDALQTTVLCRRCGFRHADVLLLSEGEPTRVEFRVREPADLAARVVRSSAGTIRVPEIGADVEPGPGAESFVSNVEGVLRRIRDVLGFAQRRADTADARENAAARIRDVDRMIDGGQSFTLILDDLTGNSAILHERAMRRSLTPEELQDLRPATYALDVEDVRTAFRGKP